jgi:MerR family transcriptional regulator, light-induced transcriptional regulator
MEESMAVRSVERTVETVLLPAVEALADDPGAATGRGGTPEGGVGGSPEYCFAWRYATGWLAAAQRVAPASTRDEGVLILDATRAFDVDALYAQALELLVRRAGLRVLTLPVDLDGARVGNALRALTPSTLVLAGQGSTLDAIGRVVYAARQSIGGLEVLDYRGALPETGATTVPRIGPTPTDAVATLRESLTSPSHISPTAARSAPTAVAAS